MNKNNLQECWCRIGRYGCVAACLATISGCSRAEAGIGRASATVVAPVSVRVTATPSLQSTVISVEAAGQRALSGAPMLRFQSAPPTVGGDTVTETGTDASAASAATPVAEESVTTDVNVTVNADGSLNVTSAENSLTFSVDQIADGPVIIEYN